MEFKIYANVSGGHADSFFGVREFEEDIFTEYYIFSNVALSEGVQSVS